MSAWIEMLDDDAADASAARSAVARENAARQPSTTSCASTRCARPRWSVTSALYRAALHDEANTLPPWLQETVASCVSLLNGCDYSFANHWANARHLIGDGARADAIEAALREDRPEAALDGADLEALRYARKLTLRPAEMVRADVEALREAGLDDGQVLEIVQIVGYFAYVNRHLNGLGVTTDGDVVGYYAGEGRG